MHRDKKAQRHIYSGLGLFNSLAKAAGSVINKGIDLLPVEVHIPGYQYCGPGTHLKKRLDRGDPGINKLDEACKVHDIAYSHFKDSRNRLEADRTLAEKAWERVKASDSSIGERAAALLVTNIMKAKSKLGGGKRKKIKQASKKKKRNNKNCTRRKNTAGRGLYLKPYGGSGIKKKKCTCLK